MKFDAIKFAYKKIDPSNYEEKISALKDKIYALFEEYVKAESSESHASRSHISPPQTSFTSDEHVIDEFDEYVAYLRVHAHDNGKSELDIYLEEGTLDPICFEKLDVLGYWKDRRERCPNLAKMASDVLSIPITIVASESTFSLGSRVLTKYRSSILPQNVELLLLTQNWLHGFEEPDEDKKDVTGEEIAISVSLQDSNDL